MISHEIMRIKTKKVDGIMTNVYVRNTAIICVRDMATNCIRNMAAIYVRNVATIRITFTEHKLSINMMRIVATFLI